MTTRDEVLDVLDRIERSGGAGDVVNTARIELLQLPAPAYDAILQRLRAAYPDLVPAPPRPAEPAGQRGAGVAALQRAEAALAHQQSAAARFDRQVLDALRHTRQRTVEGRRTLDETAVRIDDAARGWDLSSAAGAREFQRFLLAELDRIMQVVEDGNDDDAAKRELAAALATLYDETAARPRPPAGDRPTAAADSGAPGPEPTTVAEPGFADPDFAEPDLADPGFAEGRAPWSPGAAMAPAMPVGPAFGGELPGVGALSGAGLPGRGLLAGPLSSAHREPTAADDGEPPAADDAPEDESVGDADPAAADAAAIDPAVVTLPNGETVRAPSPQLAAVLQAAVGGTPISTAFTGQGITIPPPGTPVGVAIDQARLVPGDIGMFTDRHALVLGDGKALLDGQIQRIANVHGPSFLGWQHPPEPSVATPSAPTSIRPPAGTAQPGRY